MGEPVFRGEEGVEYRPIPSRPGYYAGRDGSIWSFIRGRPLKRKLAVLPNRRLYVTFATPPLTMQVSRLVLETFVGPCPDGMECCHGEGGCSDNRPENLRWGTRDSNVADMHRRDEMAHRKGEGNHNAALTADLVLRIVAMSAEGVRVMALARSLGVNPRAVSGVIKGRTWNHVTGFPKSRRNRRKTAAP